MIRLRLMRIGKTNQPYFRIVACEKQAPPKASFLDILGNFDPIKHKFTIDKEKLEKWVKNGAQPSNTLNNLLVKEGIWSKSKLIKKSVKPNKKDEKESTKSTISITDKTSDKTKAAEEKPDTAPPQESEQKQTKSKTPEAEKEKLVKKTEKSINENQPKTNSTINEKTEK